MDRRKSIVNPRNLIICVTTCTVAAVWAVIFAALYFYFFGQSGSQSPVVHNVTQVRTMQPYQRELLPWYMDGPIQPTTTLHDNQVALWHHQIPHDPFQRLLNQLMFFPKGNGDTKIVLFWSDWSPRETVDYKTQQCPVKSCVFTNSRKSFNKASAVVFRGPAKLLSDFPHEERPNSQVWIFNSLTMPGEAYVHPRDVFNWTATPRLDADIPMFPHGVWLYYNPLWKHQDPPMNLVGQKTLAAAAWFPRTCDERSRAYEYVNRLVHFTLVDGFGDHPACGDRCPQGRTEICLKLLADKYRVTLVLEDRLCNHTIPNMFYVALQANTVPVVMWPPRSVYEQLVPEGSFIHTDDFPSPRDLAWHLDTIYNDDMVFNRYLSWQGTGLFVKSWYCRLCAMLHHNSMPDLTIEDINQWWDPDGECFS
uniref:Fucosyltransferase n=2 Tax=Homalodisca liturata TaxID=320908 RepID=A0A1B6IBL5_9HEMI